MNYLKNIIGLTLFITFMSCGGDSDDSEPIIVVTPPSASTLIFPINNEECLTSSSVNATQSTVNFQWNTSSNTTSYTLYLKNLITLVETTQSTSLTNLGVTLQKNTPYSWWVESKATGTTKTAKSAVWKFYNTGEAIKNYIPFPAALISPKMGVSVNETLVLLEWLGSDLDNDILEYDVYLGTSKMPTVKIKTITSQKIEGVEVLPGKTYYWKVVTKDSFGNSSNSEIFQFKTN